MVLVVLSLSACRMSCFGTPARQIDSPVAQKLNAPSADAVAPFDHSAFDGLLARHARPDMGRVDYKGLSAEGPMLEAYAKRLGDVALESLSRVEQKALLINAYNAFTLLLILENYPLASIKDLPSPWKTKRWKLGGDVVSLDDIEHGLLRPTYKDPRVHFALNCASIGCPPLADSAFVGEALDAQLDEATRRALTDSRYARVDGPTLHVTALMNWYGDDFVAEGWSPRAATVAAFVALYRDDVAADATVEFLDYDWRLNDVE